MPGGYLDLYHSAIHKQLHSGHVTRIIRCKEYHRLGDFVGGSHPAQRHLRRQRGFQAGDLIRTDPSISRTLTIPPVW